MNEDITEEERKEEEATSRVLLQQEEYENDETSFERSKEPISEETEEEIDGGIGMTREMQGWSSRLNHYQKTST